MRSHRLLGVALLALGNQRLAAQEWEPPLLLAANVVSTRAFSDSTGERTAFGAGGLLGVAFHMGAEAFFRFDVGAADARLVGHADLALRYAPRVLGRLIPYVEGAVSSRGQELSDDRMLLALGGSLGIGTELLLRSNRSVDIEVVWWRGGRDELQRAGRTIARDLVTHARTTRLIVGYRLRPRRR